MGLKAMGFKAGISTEGCPKAWTKSGYATTLELEVEINRIYIGGFRGYIEIDRM